MLQEMGMLADKSNCRLSTQIGRIFGVGFWINFILLVVILFWVLSIIWVAKDIMARTSKLSYQILCVFLITFLSPILGLPIYLVIRPIDFSRNRLPWREATVMGLIVCYNC